MLLLDENLTDLARSLSAFLLLLVPFSLLMCVIAAFSSQWLLVPVAIVIGNATVFCWWVIRQSIRDSKPYTSDIFVTAIVPQAKVTFVSWLLCLCGFHLYIITFSQEPDKDYTAISPHRDLPAKGRLRVGEMPRYHLYWVE